jgi:anti-sigma factor RsiW
MTGCDHFETETEKRRQGALGEAESRALEAHLSTCERCRAYEAMARRTEAVMRAEADEGLRGVDWGRVEEAIRGWRRRSTIVLGTWAVLGVLLAAQAWRHFGESGPAEHASLVAGLFLAALGLRLAVDLVRRRRVAAMARGPLLLDLLRTDLRERRRAIWLSLVLFPMLTAFFAWQALAESDAARRPLLGVAALICIVTWLAVWFVKRPRLAREQAAFDGASERPAK